MLEAAAENTYARSVAATPSEYWKSRTSTISINRYTEGVRNTVKVYEVFKPLSELVLPPRAPRGDPRNWRE
ncbi:MAG: hypothetical protein QXQ91_03395 [Nanopusillaceae archaeon]